MSKLTSRQSFFLLLALFLLLVDIFLALCIPLIFPLYLSKTHYVRYDSDESKIILRCSPTCSKEFDEPCFTEPFTLRALPRKLSEVKPKIDYLNYVVAIYQHSYKNYETQRLICSGAAVSNNWIVTGADCFKGIKDHTGLEIRYGSKQWVKGGQTQKITKITPPHEGLVAVEVKEPMPITGWEKLHKNSDETYLHYLQWTSSEQPNTLTAKTKNSRCDDGVGYGTPVFIRNQLFSIITCATIDSVTFADLDLVEVKNWINSLTGNKEITEYTSNNDKPTQFYVVGVQKSSSPAVVKDVKTEQVVEETTEYQKRSEQKAKSKERKKDNYLKGIKVKETTQKPTKESKKQTTTNRKQKTKESTTTARTAKPEKRTTISQKSILKEVRKQVEDEHGRVRKKYKNYLQKINTSTTEIIITEFEF